MRPWADRLVETWDEHEDVFVYTNNDPTGAALRDAEHLALALHRRGRSTTRVGTRGGRAPEHAGAWS